MTTTAAACNAIAELIRSANYERGRAKRKRLPILADQLDLTSRQLDAVRTTLVQEGDEYLQTAWAFVDAGRLTLAKIITRIERRQGYISLDCRDGQHAACATCDCQNCDHRHG